MLPNPHSHIHLPKAGLTELKVSPRLQGNRINSEVTKRSPPGISLGLLGKTSSRVYSRGKL